MSIKNTKHKTGFSLIEIIVSLAILAIMFSFIFYFISSINIRDKNIDKKPYILENYNYSDKYCYLEESQLNQMYIINDFDLSSYISTSTPITSINIFRKDKIIITTNSASTTEADILIFDFPSMSFKQKIDVGPGINDALLHDDFLYVLNTSVNSHVKNFKINLENNSINLSQINDVKINELSSSYALPKKIYLFDNLNNKNIIIGTEKNNNGGEIFILPLDENNEIKNPIKSIEINGQVNNIYINQGLIYIANASDIELFIYDKDFNLINSYDAPLSLGNGKSVFYLEPYIYFGRTVSSFELYFIEFKNMLLNIVEKYKTYGSIDFIQNIDKYILIISSSENKELQFFDKNMNLIKTINLPSRLNTFTCVNNIFLSANIINNQSHILWLK